MAHPVDAAYLAAIVAPHGVRTRITTIDVGRDEVDELTGEEGYVFGGRVTMDRLRNPSRSLDGLTVQNPSGIWTPRTLADRFALFRRLKVERGIVQPNGAVVLFPLMIGMIEAPNQQLTWDDDTLTISCHDLWRIFAAKRLRSTLRFEPGQSVNAVLRGLAVAGGWPDDDAWLDVNEAGGQLTTALVFEQWGLVAEFLEKVAADWSLWLRVAADGTLTASPAPTSATALASTATFAPGETSTLLEVTKGLGAENLYNATVVIVEGRGMGRRTFTARDLNPASATYNPPPGLDPAWPNGGPLGDRIREPWRTATKLDDVAAQTKATQLLFESALIEATHDFSAFADPRLEPGDAIELEVEEADITGSQLIDTLTVSLSEGDGDDEMKAGCKQLRSLVAA